MNEMFPVYKGMLANNNHLIPYYLPVYYLLRIQQYPVNNTFKRPLSHHGRYTRMSYS